MIYRFIKLESATYSVTTLCKVMGVSRSGYYDCLDRPLSARSNEDLILSKEIKAAHEKSYGTYGKRRIQKQLIRHGRSVGLSRISRLMSDSDIRSKAAKTHKVTTDSNHNKYISPNVLNRQFHSDKPNQAWVSDITYIRCRQGFVYLAVILDLFSRRVIGWSINDQLHSSIINQALDMAVINRKNIKGCLLHSDQGSQYASTSFRNRLKRYKLKQSMSRRGNCWDNAPCESFFHSLKVEWIGKKIYKDLEEVKSHIFHFIERFYNRFRLHSANNFYSPEEYESMHCAA
jgi:transposase InsO family protein